MILIVAIVVGVVAAFLVWNYVQGIEDDVSEDSKEIEVFVARETVVRGEDGGVALDQGLIQTDVIPQKYYPATAIKSADEIAKKVALFDIAPGTVIVQGMFVDPSTTQISFRDRLKNPDHVAISFSVDSTRGVGGFLVPGDEVNMMITATVPDEAKTALAEQAGAGPDAFASQGPQPFIWSSTQRYMYQKVQILAVGEQALLAPGEQATTGEDGETATNSGLLTVNVPPDAAQYIATGALHEGGYYLSLVRGDYAPRELLPLPVTQDLLPGEDAGILTPYGPEGNVEE
ncbi:MAG: Flp pilus assembly protein CpaB [Acidimicrobiales bacterium]|nr:Flp pilus assembly protein CpaB [Acidimicrobiales bacterium]